MEFTIKNDAQLVNVIRQYPEVVSTVWGIGRCTCIWEELLTLSDDEWKVVRAIDVYLKEIRHDSNV